MHLTVQADVVEVLYDHGAHALDVDRVCHVLLYDEVLHDVMLDEVDAAFRCQQFARDADEGSGGREIHVTSSYIHVTSS